MKSLRYSLIWILFWLFGFLTENLHAQLSPYHGLIFPYDNPNIAVYSIESLTHEATDYSANIHNKPSSFVSIQKPQMFLNVSHDISRYYITDIKINEAIFYNGFNNKEKKLKPKYKFFLGFISCTVPLSVFNQKISLSLSLNQIMKPEHEVWLVNQYYADLNFQHQRNGQVWKRAINIGYQLPLNIKLEVTWSKWFGNWSWYDYNTSQSVIGKGKFKYDGDNFGIAFLKKYKNNSISFCYYAPFSLMKANNIVIQNMCEMNYGLQQKFDGAFKFGIGHQLNNKLMLSFAFRYQNTFSMKEIMLYPTVEGLNSINMKHKYSSSHQIAIAFEYIILFRGKKLPTFLSYWANLLPKKEATYGANYVELTFPNIYQELSNHFLYDNNFVAGIYFPFYHLNINLTSQLNIYPIRAIFLPNNYSHIIPPLRLYARRMELIFNFGVSYNFKK